MMSFSKQCVIKLNASLFVGIFLVFLNVAEARQVNVKSYDYAVKDGESLYMDVYQQDDITEKQPVFVFMHGGGFYAGTPKHPDHLKLGEMVAEKGYTAIMISYRLTRKGGSFGCDYPASGKIETFKLAAEDFYDSIQFIKENQEELKVDFSSLYVGGSSAGAEAVLNAIFNAELLFDETESYPEYDYSGILSLAGALVDVRYIPENPKIPTVFVHGIDDKIVPFDSAPHHLCSSDSPGYLMLDGSNTMAEKFNDLNASYLLYGYKNSGHEKSGIPFDTLDEIFDFFEKTKSTDRIIQQKIVQ